VIKLDALIEVRATRRGVHSSSPENFSFFDVERCILVDSEMLKFKGTHAPGLRRHITDEWRVLVHVDVFHVLFNWFLTCLIMYR
jgi:hypothetical protein